MSQNPTTHNQSSVLASRPQIGNYNPARTWTVSEPRCHRHSPPCRARSYTPTPSRQPTRCSRSVSFARNNNLPNRSNNAQNSRSPVRPVNVNIITPTNVTPVLLCDLVLLHQSQSSL